MKEENIIGNKKVAVYSIFRGEKKVGFFFDEELAIKVNIYLNELKEATPTKKLFTAQQILDAECTRGIISPDARLVIDRIKLGI